MDKEQLILFPEPQIMEVEAGRIFLGSRGKGNSVLLLQEAKEELQVYAGEIIKKSIAESIIGKNPCIVTEEDEGQIEEVLISLERVPCNFSFGEDAINSEEAYIIETSKNRISLKAKSAAGLFYAAQTFGQLLKAEGEDLYFPMVKIIDWPQLKYRGLFIESKWGPDRMTLDDWKETIDFIADLKMNFLGVGIYGCWNIQYKNQITEFLTVPIKKYPELSTPKTIEYYSPSKGDLEVVDYLPTIFSEDLFGNIIAYGKKRNVIVRPQFNSLGHNTLIPRTFPEVSSKDEDGNAKNYGFCTSNPKTYEVLFDIYDEIIDGYLLPNGVDYFHLGMDEIYPLVGIDAEHPRKSVDPWCQCPECSKSSQEELLVDFLLKITNHVKEKGINNITIWNDQLVRHMNVLDEGLVNKIKEDGLFDKLILNWWWYSPNVPETIRPELGLRTFVCPMTGYYFWMNYQSYLLNIYRMLKLGYEQGSEGSEAYCTFDYSFHRNKLCLAEYSWNQKKTGSLDDFREKYIKGTFGADAHIARDAFEHFDKVVEPDGLGAIVNSTLIYYRYSYVRKGLEYPRDYPGEAFTKLYEDIESARENLQNALDEISEARKGFVKLREGESGQIRLIDHYIVECKRYETVLRAYLQLLDIEDMYKTAAKAIEGEPSAAGDILNKLVKQANELLRSQDELMARIEKVKSQYLLPHTMRDLTFFRNFLVSLLDFLDGVLREVKTGAISQLPALDLKNTQSIVR